MAAHDCHYRRVLLDIKAAIEGTQSNEVRGHFTVNRPMAEMAQIYAMACSGLATAVEDELRITWRTQEDNPKIQRAYVGGKEIGYIRQAGSVHAYGVRTYQWFPTIKRAKAFVEEDYARTVQTGT